jgi:peptidoglycan/LPS O-acetylase OafA/YrhL
MAPPRERLASLSDWTSSHALFRVLDIAPKLEGKHIPSLDGIRGLAFGTVFLAHAGASLVPGGFGVTTFFFLSGYLITALLRNELARTGTVSLRSFYARRAIRILPPMYTAMLVAVLCDWTSFHGDPDNWWTLGLQAAHLANYAPYLSCGAGPAGTGVLWSLAVEEHFYLMYPLLFVCLAAGTPQRRLAAVLGALCVAVMAWRFVLASKGVSLQYIQHATDTRIDSLAFGCIMGLIGDPHRKELGELSRTTKVAMLISGLGLLLVSFLWRNPLFRGSALFTVQGLGLGPLFYLAVSERNNPLYRALNWLPLRCLGTISYSAYLLHDVVINLVERHTTWTGLPRGALALVGTIVAAYVMYFMVERPWANLRQKLRIA